MSLVKFEDVWFKYRDNWVLKGVNFNLSNGELVTLTGRNGAGKTTLAKHLNGLLKPDKGQVHVNGYTTSEKTTAELSKKVGYIFQNPDNQIFCDSVLEEVMFGPENHDLKNPREKALSALEKVGLGDRKDNFTFSLSKGQKKRLTIASILAMKPEILVLDEPFQGQDRNECLRILKVCRGLSEEGRLVILISHDVGMVLEWTDRLLILKGGKVSSQGTSGVMGK